MIELKNVNKYFNKGKKNEIHVINDTTLTLPNEGLVALLGPSGCGKTTLLNAIGGLDSINKGEILIDSQNMTATSTRKVDRLRNLTVGYIFQDYKLVDDMTVYENVAFVLKMVGIKDANEMKERVSYVLDKVGMLRYQHRPASMLSGGERQRVGIARALVKNPDIILADEPTGNLDSANSVEIMNIIKTISKDRLVILVTHERPLAEFYATRIIELEDGKVVKDYENSHDNSLEYDVDNVFYLKEFERQTKASGAKDSVSIYGSKEDSVNLTVVVKNGNIYVQGNPGQHVEVVDEQSGIELVDDYKKVVDRASIENYDFHLGEVGNPNLPKKYSSVQNLWRAFVHGIKKIGNYTTLRKLLLFGFVLAGFFIMFSFGRIGAAMHVEQKDYITNNSQYIKVTKPSMSVKEFKTLWDSKETKYVLPGEGILNFRIPVDDYYQTRDAIVGLKASLTSNEFLTQDMLVYGRMPKNSQEIVVDKMVLQNTLQGYNDTKMVGLTKAEDFLDLTATLQMGSKYKIVGITDRQEPNVYMARDQFTWSLYYNNDEESMQGYGVPTSVQDDSKLGSYVRQKKYYTLRSGSLPTEDYTCIVNYSQKDMYPLNRTLDTKVNGKKLKVVGYYESSAPSERILVNNNMLLYSLINDAEKFTICPASDKAATLQMLTDKEYNAEDALQADKKEYKDMTAGATRTTIILAAIILVMSLVEMYLISRSSFLSRIKEVGTLRAIGMKKWDIYKMFMGEILAVTTITSLPAILLTYLVVNRAQATVPLLDGILYQTPMMLLGAIALIYGFNLLVGLIPVWNTMRKRPAAILARYDVD